MANNRKKEIDRINKLSGNQARVMLLYLLQWGYLDSIPYERLKDGFELAESYHPDTFLATNK